MSGVSEIIGTFRGTEGGGDHADATAKAVYGSLCGFAQMRFDFAEAILDRVEIGGVLRQITQCCTGRFNRLAHARDLARWHIIHNDRIATPRLWKEKLL